MEKLNINFGTPEDGWMEILISSPSDEISLNVSDVPCDSLYGLLEVLTRLFDGSTEEVVEWSLEPEYAKWIFRREGDEIELSVSRAADPVTGFIFRCEASKLIHRIYKSLRNLETDPAWEAEDAKERAWSWDFPSDRLVALREKMTKAKQGAPADTGKPCR
jgi:hypothetical protein